MRLVRITLAYLAAAAVGAGALLFSIWAAEGFGNLGGTVFFLMLGIPFGAMFAAPVALPAIIVSEWRGISNWAYFAAAGVSVGILLISITASYPLKPEFLIEIAVFMLAGLAAAITYWWFAGRSAGKQPFQHQSPSENT